MTAKKVTARKKKPAAAGTKKASTSRAAGTTKSPGATKSKSAAPKKKSPAARKPGPAPAKPPAKAVAPSGKKTAAKKGSASKPSRPAPKKTAGKAAASRNPAPATPSAGSRKKSTPAGATRLKAAEIRALRDALQELRERVVKEIEFLSGDNLNRNMRETSGDLSSYSLHMADQGTDNYDRDFALNLVSSEQDTLYEIDAALQRMGEGGYGQCEVCGGGIEKARLEALPFAVMCIGCKGEAEKGKSRFKAFGELFKG